MSDLSDHACATLKAVAPTLMGRSDDDPIETDVRTLRHLTNVIATLNAKLETSIHAQHTGCDNPACMGADIDGIKFWIPAPHFESMQEKSKSVAQRAQHYAHGLRQIADQHFDVNSDYSLLIDWENIARRFQQIARVTLKIE